MQQPAVDDNNHVAYSAIRMRSASIVANKGQADGVACATRMAILCVCGYQYTHIHMYVCYHRQCKLFNFNAFSHSKATHTHKSSCTHTYTWRVGLLTAPYFICAIVAISVFKGCAFWFVCVCVVLCDMAVTIERKDNTVSRLPSV